jgi:preprotein translocase subunit SecB
MKIKLDQWNIVNLNFSVVEDRDRKDNSFDLNIGHFFPENTTDTFGVGFEIEIKDKRFDLNLEAVFMFSVDEEINEAFKLSDFPKINAPAIAFPYLRAFISNLTLQSGFDPIMLPSINFVSLAKEKETEG